MILGGGAAMAYDPNDMVFKLDDSLTPLQKANEMVILPVINVAKLVTPIMEKQEGGSIVNITTFSAFEPNYPVLSGNTY